MVDEKLLRQEVEELTELLHSDPAWEDLRKAIRAKSLPPDEVVVGGFFEDEEDGEFGAIVTADGKVYEFERSSLPGASGFKRWRTVDDVSALSATFPAVATALAMVGKSRA